MIPERVETAGEKEMMALRLRDLVDVIVLERSVGE
jgi:hypothetical protein